jgi:peroxiredoxin
VNSHASAMEASNFNLTTLEGTKIELSKLSGKLIILRFPFATGFHLKQEIRNLTKK